MIYLYYTRYSIYSRFVWLTLLEKKLSFELVAISLDGRQFLPEFRAINPFGQIPVLVDHGFRVIESAAILDYLEAKYPVPALLPKDVNKLAEVRMVQNIAVNKILPNLAKLIIDRSSSLEQEDARLQIINALNFLTNLLADKLYFGGDKITLADITAGILIPELPRLDIPLTNYPQLEQWCNRLLSRDSWQQIWLNDEEFQDFQRRFRILPKIWQQRRRQRTTIFASQN